MPKRKQSIRELKKEARSRFERFIAAELSASADVGTDVLAKDFFNKEEPLLKKISHHTLINILVKWADDILNQSIATEAARNGQPQLVLPLNLQGIEVPGAFSFINGANRLRFVANYKAEKFHLESHRFILRKHDEEVHNSRLDFERMYDAVEPVMNEKPGMTLLEALEYLREQDQGAA
jgi:hypothetical protein